MLDRRHEDEELALARLDAERGAGDPGCGLTFFGGSGFVFGGLGQIWRGRFDEEMRLAFGMRGQQFASGKGIGIEAVGDVFGAGPGE